MDADTEKLLAAERAAEWLVRLETATPEELAELWDWLRESPLHVREMLLAQACDIELARAIKNARRFDHCRLVPSASNVYAIEGELAPRTQGDASKKAPVTFLARVRAMMDGARRLRRLIAALLFIALLSAAAAVLHGTTHERITTAKNEMPLE